MLTTTLSAFRKDIKKYIDTVLQNDETLVINRGKDSGVIIMSLAEYNSLCATHHELSSKENKRRLDSAIARLRAGQSSYEKLIEE